MDNKENFNPGRYDFAAIEARWQKYWAEHQTFRTPNPGDPGFDAGKPKFYVLDMFPYPSGAGLHVGHPLGYCGTDIVARYKRMRGFNVLHPMGFDAFGLPAEQYAVETNVHPALTTRKNIDMYRRQLQMFGFSYDWSRELATCDPGYYKFTQWMFKQMFESWYDDECHWVAPDGAEVRGRARPIRELVEELSAGRWSVDVSLNFVRAPAAPPARPWAQLSPIEQRRALDRCRLAYLGEIPVNWCPALGTVLANEEVDSEGRSERGGHPVFRRPLRQWMLRITQYAERLLADLDGLDWPEPIQLMQRNWVGRSIGAEVAFPLADHWRIEGGTWLHNSGASPRRPADWPDAIRVYTTRPDTLFGATYMVLAAEHELVERITSAAHRAQVDQYVEASRRKSDLARTAEAREKTGVFTGAYAINPVNGAKIPIWIADYVLLGYGTGAIMAVPGSDTRDYAFARTFSLPIRTVVRPTAAWIEERICAMTANLSATAAEGFDRIASDVPELAASVAAHRAKAADLAGKTAETLRNRVGIDRLVEHFVRHPETWGQAYTDPGIAVNSPGPCDQVSVPGAVCRLDGLPTEEAKSKIIEWLQATGVGRAAVNYKLRDWLFSRQRYWGEPFPVLHGEDGEIRAVEDDELPVELPDMADFRPTQADESADSLPEPPLARARDWIRVVRGRSSYRRDVNTMPQWAGSCWYYLRFINPHNRDRFCDARAEAYWMPVDLYVGGAEHAVLHLLYARFWHKVLFDLGFVCTREPFHKLFNQGMIQGFAFRDSRGTILGPDQVTERGSDQFVHARSGEPVQRVVAKMSKSLKNVVNPDQIIAQYGADTFRLYEMFMGPLDASKPWNTRDVPGLFRLCQKVWRLFVDEGTGELHSAVSGKSPDESSLRPLHKLIRRVTDDIEALKFNTAIAAIFDFVNAVGALSQRPRNVLEIFLLVFSPFAPHLAEELWRRLGHEESLAYQPWPAFDEKLARDEQVELAVQINGKIKVRILAPADAQESLLQAQALAEPKVTEAIAGRPIRKVIVVKGRLVNILL